MENPLNPALALGFHNLYTYEGLVKLDAKFDEFLREKNVGIHRSFSALKKDAAVFSVQEKNAIMLDVARVLEDFIAYVFLIEKENLALQNSHNQLQKIYLVKRDFVQRVVAKKFKEAPLGLDGLRVLAELEIVIEEEKLPRQKEFFGKSQSQLAAKNIAKLEKQLAEKIFNLLEKEKNFSEEEKLQIELLELYSAWALYSVSGKRLHEDGALFKLPQKIDHQKLFEFEKSVDDGKISACHAPKNRVDQALSNRDGFNLTDKGFNLNQTLAEAHYCIFCHNQQKDSCRTGIEAKAVDKNFKQDPLGLELHGCPLDQKISEMNLLKSEGFSLASLAFAALDNPLLAGTGHRICNDCMKACIFQKQDPVNIPQIETETLKDVLNLPYGFEIYSLLTRWNPLNIAQPIIQKNSGKKILVAGLGPAGYTLAHYLLNDGHTVVAIDGLKIEPLSAEISGIDLHGNRAKFKPIKYLSEIYEPLSSRAIQGFGGVAEYGITVRWDKNFLKIIRLLLERRENFRMFGGLRFGSTITDKTAFEQYGFDHVALCIGAGRPNIINLKNHYAKGVRSASDFLMSLQLNGAFKEELFTNLQLRLPILVIGAGLTAVDTACEAQQYYLVQIKKFAQKFLQLSQVFGEEKIWQKLNEEEKIIAKEFLDHAAEIRATSAAEFIKKHGAAKIIYRKKIQDAPSYKLNHQELEKAFAEGIEFIENIEPLEIITDKFNHVEALKCKLAQAAEKNLPCKTLLVAAGTTPNISPVLEDNLNFKLDGKYFESIDENGQKISVTHSAKPSKFSILTKIDQQDRGVSFFGDLHPNFEGNVVKAMASAKVGHKTITNLMLRNKGLNEVFANNKNSVTGSQKFLQKINEHFTVKIAAINRLSDHVVEVLVHAPLLAQQTQIGQIFRLQNYHALAKKTGGQLLAMEGIPVTALSVDTVSGIISGIVVETGGSASLIKNFKPHEPCIFMGPSGKPTEIAKNETVLLIGGGRGNMPLTAIAQAYKQNGCKIIFCAGYRKNSFITRQKEMEKFSDILIYAVEEEVPNVKLHRPQDQQYQGTVIDALKKYFAEKGEVLEKNLALQKKTPSQNQQKIDRIFTIGSDKMMAAIAKLRHEGSIFSLTAAPIAITSLNAPMQCMLKGVCSQCLQKRKNDAGEMEYFYSCASQDQNMDKLDFAHLHARCEQNSLQEKITRMWIEYLAK